MQTSCFKTSAVTGNGKKANMELSQPGRPPLPVKTGLHFLFLYLERNKCVLTRRCADYLLSVLDQHQHGGSICSSMRQIQRSHASSAAPQLLSHNITRKQQEWALHQPFNCSVSQQSEPTFKVSFSHEPRRPRRLLSRKGTTRGSQ